MVAFAQQATPAPLSLADAIAVARENNPAYRQTLSTRIPSLWSARNAWGNLLIPNASLSGGLGYSGAGSQNFLSTNFSQPVSTSSSDYSLNLNWQLNGQTLAAPGQQHANADAVDADIAGARAALTNNVTQQYLTALQSRDNAAVTQKQLESTEQALKLAQAKYQVGSGTLLDVRQAQVARGQAEVALLQGQTDVQVQKLRLFEQMGVTAPTDIKSVQLSDSFAIEAPKWTVEDLLTLAAEQNPALQALRARASAGKWNVRAATAGYGPSVSLSASWSGFTQRFNDLGPIVASSQAAAGQEFTACNENNQIRLNAGLAAEDCSGFQWGTAQQQALQTQNSAYPFNFTKQPFSARLTFSIPLWSNFQQPLQVSLAKQNHEQMEESVRARALGLQTEVNQAFLTLGTAYQTIAIQDTNRTAARDQLKLASDRYQVGSGTFLDVINAEVTAIRAETDYVNAVYNYHKALAALEAAVGRPLR
jgi:outer membrane protein